MKKGLVSVRFRQDWRQWQAGKVYELSIGDANALCNNSNVAEYCKPIVKELDGGLTSKKADVPTFDHDANVAKAVTEVKPKRRHFKRA